MLKFFQAILVSALSLQAAPDTISFALTGDIMLGTEFPRDFLPPDASLLLRPAHPYLQSADLAFGNHEGVLADSGKCTKNTKKNPDKVYAFRSPTRYGRLFKEAGFDFMSLANNHANDFGAEGQQSTRKVLAEQGVLSADFNGRISVIERKGFRIALTAFHTSGSYKLDLNRIQRARKWIRSLKDSSDLLVVSFHGGAEGRKALHLPHGPEKAWGENRGDVEAFAHAVIDEGADLVVGHGPHVPRAMEVYKERLILYSLGNFASYGRFNLSGVSGYAPLVLVFLDSNGKFLSGKIVPFLQKGEGGVQADSSGKVIRLMQKLGKEDFPKTTPTIHKDGVFD